MCVCPSASDVFTSSSMCGSKSQEDQKGQFDGRESQTEDSIHHRSVSNGMKEKHRPMQCKVRHFSMTDKKTKIGKKKENQNRKKKKFGAMTSASSKDDNVRG